VVFRAPISDGETNRMTRDRDVRNAIQAALVATGAFDPNSVWIWGLPEDYGTGASSFAAAAIEPGGSQQSDEWDDTSIGALNVKSSVLITLLYRHEDPQLRDEAVELLFDTAANALNGQCFAGITLPGFTKFRRWDWCQADPPERRIRAIFEYMYLVEGWNEYDVTP